MNWLGRIFVVVILVMSVVFMTLSLAVYATHKNWKATGESLKAQLTQSQQDYDILKSKYNQRESELTAENESLKQQVAKLATEEDSLTTQNKTMQAELDQLRQERREATAAVAATQQNNARLAEEVTKLREDIRTNQQARDQAFATTLQSTEELHQVKGQLDTTGERNRQLLDQVAGMTSAMRENGLDPNTDPNSIVPRVDGMVSQVRQSGGDQLIEVTIGADDGLKVGNTVEVYRDNKYLGRVDILKTSPDRAVGRIDRRFQIGQIQEGDRVATRFKVN
jgi:hypothetical protein